MTKAEIVEVISEKLGLTKKDVARVIDLFFDIIKEGLRKEEHIELRGLKLKVIKEQVKCYNSEEKERGWNR